MKTAFAICMMFIGLQPLNAFAQELTVPPVPPQSCDAPRFNPSLSFLHAPDSAFDEGPITASIAAAPPVSDAPIVLPDPSNQGVKKAKHQRKKHSKHK